MTDCRPLDEDTIVFKAPVCYRFSIALQWINCVTLHNVAIGLGSSVLFAAVVGD